MNKKDVLLLKANWQIILVSFILGFLFSCIVSISLLLLLSSYSPTPISTETQTLFPTFTHSVTPTFTPSWTPISTNTPTATGITPLPFIVSTVQEHPSGTSGKCADGTYTKSKNRQGACSHHGGLLEWWGK